ncbi:MAG: IPT/TIG domain-containing protein, partial [Actinobacteria bacterium]|nr:IPT/TIG domain-containing protein [Actinomycetota bacterium]
TSNSGVTWAAQNSTTTNGLNGISAASTTVAWAVGAGGTIVKTANGTTWAAQTSTTTNGLRGVSSVSTNDVWAVGELRAIIGTTNGGTNWNVRSTIPHSCALYGVDFPAASDGFAVGSGGTIVKTSNSGVTWAAQTSTTTNDLNGISAASTTVAWAVGAGGTIVNTINGGTTWAAQTSTTTNDLNGVSSASTTVTWAVGELRAIIKTINGGTNWTHLLGISGPGGLYGVDVTPGGTVYASGFKDGTPDDGIVVNTADSGATFNVESPGTALHLYAIDCRDNNNMWAVGGGSGAGVVFHGDPAVPGAWTNQYPAVPNELHGVYADINGASYEIIAVGDNGYITYSTNSGGAWSPPPSITDEFNRNDLSGVWYENTGAVTGTGFAVGDDGTIMTTADRGATWAFQLGPANRLNDTSFQNTTDGWCVGTRGTIINTINGGTNWNVQDSAVTDDLNGVNFINAVYGWAVGENNVSLYTTSGGATWIPGPALTADLNDVFVYDDSGVSGNYLIWACGDGGVLRYTTNLAPGGAPAAWITPATAPPVEDLHGVYALNATDVWAVGANGTIANSIDGGANWGTQTSGVGVTLYGVCIADALNAWAVGDSGTIVNTTDGGANWGTQTSGTNACLYDVQFGDRSRTDIRNGWVVGAFAPPSQEGTVLATTDGGSSWNPETSNTGVGKGLYGLDLAWDGSNWAGYAAGDWGRVQKHTNATSQPEITLPLTPNQGPVTPPTAVTITGANFGADQATVNGHVYFYGGVDAGTASTWNNTTIIINVPSGAYSGLVHVVHEGGSSNGENFTVLPSITNVIPDPMSGGDTVTVTGEGFGDDPGAGSRSTAQENVKVGTYQMPDPNVTFWSNTQIEFTLPDDVDPGTAVGVTVTAGGNTSVGHNVVVKPEITSLTPSQGRTGDTITVSGANFGADPGPGFRATATHNVFINTSTVPQMVPDADVTSWAYNSIEFTIPYDFGTVRPRTGDVTVMSNSSTSAAGTTLTILPKIDPGGVTPDSGYVGDMIHVDGTCFGDTQGELNGKVYFNGVDAGAAVIWDDRDIDVHVPADATTGDVKVTTDGGDSNVLPFTVKPFLSSLSKNSGRVGDTVEITGTGFGPTKGAGTVKFNGVNATVTAWGSASITVTVPNDATSGEVVVTTTGGSTTGTNFWVMPTITSVDPTTGVPGDTVVTIKGYTYGATQGNSEVQFAGVSAGKAQSWSRTEIKVKVPGNAASGEVVVSTEGGISNGVFFSVGPKITSIEPGNGPPGIEVTIKGDNLKAIQGAGKVEFNGLDAGTANSWSETEIKIKVPTGATTGDVVVTTTDGPSNGVPFTVGPANIMYFAEGTTRPGFDQWICIMNPNDEVANVDITYMMSDGSTMPQLVVVEPTSRSTIKVIDAIGPDKDVSTKIASDKPVIAERPIYFSYHGLWTGGHDVVGAIAPATEWYFAEGTTRDGFDEWLCLQNPNATTVDVEITYMLQGGEVRTQTVEILPTSRETIDVKGFLGPNIDCSAKVTADAGIIAERPMYFNYQGYTALNWTGGHDVMGATSPATEWYFAEGTTRDGFDEWLCVQNPGLAPALVYISYMLGTGENLVQVEEVGAQSRKTISVAEFLGRGHDVSMTLTSNQPIVAERSMYFNYVGLPGGHDVVGATAPAAEWYFAEGATQNGFQEWLCIQNPNNEEAEVTITYMLGTGETQDQVITVKPRSRETVDVNSAVGWGKDVSARVTSSKPIIVERPMYFNYMSKWPGGHDVIGFSW